MSRREYDGCLRDAESRGKRGRSLARLLGPAKRVLDVGTGSGLLVAAMPAALRVGIDFRRDLFGATSAVRFVQADAGALPFRPGFDLVVCAAVIGELPDWRGALAEMRRVAPDGRVYVTVANARVLLPLYRFWRFLGGSVRDDHWTYALHSQGIDLPGIEITDALLKDRLPWLPRWLCRLLAPLAPSRACLW